MMLELIYFKDFFFQKISQFSRLSCFIKIMFVFSLFDILFFLKTQLTIKRFIFRTLRNMLSSYLHYLIDLVNSSKKLFKMIPDFLLQEIRYIFLYINTIVITYFLFRFGKIHCLLNKSKVQKRLSCNSVYGKLKGYAFYT